MLARSSCLAPIPFALVVAQPPDEDPSLPVVLVLVTLHPDFSPLHGAKIIRAKRGQLATCVQDGIPMTGAVPAIPNETSSVDRADERLGDIDLPALAARQRSKRWKPRGLGHPRGP
jgi:hypothetical protein